MSVVRAFVILVLGAAIGVAVDRLVVDPERDSQAIPPPIGDSRPGPGDPPVVWVEGNLQAVEAGRITIREGRGPEIRIERFAGGATRFFSLGPDGWVEVPTERADGIEAGTKACVETLLDGRTFLAVRVFLGAECTPSA